MSDDERALRAELERVQHENKQLRMRVAELQAFSVEELIARISALEQENFDLRTRLERADMVREDWHRRTKLLAIELETARKEQERLRTLLQTARDERSVGARSLIKRVLSRE